MTYIDEVQVEIVTVDYFRELGYQYIQGSQIAPDSESLERAGARQMVMPGYLVGTIDGCIEFNERVAVEAAIREVG